MNISIRISLLTLIFLGLFHVVPTDRILIHVTSASEKNILYRIEEAHEFTSGYMLTRDGLKTSRYSFMAG